MTEQESPEKRGGPSTRSIVLWGVGMLMVLGLAVPGAYVFLAVRDVRKALAHLSVRKWSLAVGDSRHPGKVYKGISYSCRAFFPDPEQAILREEPGTVRGLGGEAAAIRKLRVYLAMPEKLAPKRMEAVYELSSCGSRAVPLLTGLLRDSDAEIRCIAAWALGKIGPEAASALPVLERLLNDPDEDTRFAAEQAISEISAGHSQSNLRPMFFLSASMVRAWPRESAQLICGACPASRCSATVSASLA